VNSPSSLQALIDALRCLPGVGPRSAQRMAFHLLQRDRSGAERLAQTPGAAPEPVRPSQRRHHFSEEPVGGLCRSPRRNARLLCVLETPGDLLMMEQAQCFDGLYFVLMGALSPLDGIGPRDIHLERLLQRAGDGIVQEVMLATNFTVEGEATAHYAGELLRAKGIKVTRIARGLPVGGELEHVDSGTLAQAVMERRSV